MYTNSGTLIRIKNSYKSLMKTVSSFLKLFLFTVLSCSILLSCSGLSNSQSISSYGTIASQSPKSIKILRKAMYNDYSGKTAQWWADNIDVYFGRSFDNSLVNEIKTIRSDVVCLIYRNGKFVKESDNEYSIFHNNGWLMKTADGHEIKHSEYSGGWYLIDIANPAVHAWLGDKIKSLVSAAQWDGVQFDDSWAAKISTYGYNCEDATTGEGPPLDWAVEPVSPYLGHKITLAELNDAEIDCMAKIREKLEELGSGKILQFNGIYRGWGGSGFWDTQDACEDCLKNSGADSFSSEAAYGQTGGDWYTESDWKESVDFHIWLNTNWLSDSPTYGDYKPNWWLPTTYCKSPPSGTVEDYAMYVFCSTALGLETDRVGLRIGNMIDQSWAQEMYATDFGSPLGNYYMVSGTHVYAKDFSKVKVLVNPTTSSYQVPIEGDYTLDGQPVTSPLTVAPHTGMILVNEHPI